MENVCSLRGMTTDAPAQGSPMLQREGCQSPDAANGDPGVAKTARPAAALPTVPAHVGTASTKPLTLLCSKRCVLQDTSTSASNMAAVEDSEPEDGKMCYGTNRMWYAALLKGSEDLKKLRDPEDTFACGLGVFPSFSVNNTLMGDTNDSSSDSLDGEVYWDDANLSSRDCERVDFQESLWKLPYAGPPVCPSLLDKGVHPVCSVHC